MGTIRPSGGVRVATGESEEAILQRRVARHIHARWKRTEPPPLVGDRAQLVPKALHQVGR